MSLTRRELIRTTASVAAISLAGSLVRAADAPAEGEKPDKPEAEQPAAPTAATATAAASTQANDRPGIAVIGAGGIGRWFGGFLPRLGDIVAICDVDRRHLEAYNNDFAKGQAFLTGHYREVLERDDVDVVFIATPDHWHSKITADAMRAGKDVYCEKPLTLTIEEGRFLCRVTRETGRVLQVGTQQRSESPFLTAVALAHAGRMGKIRHVTVAVGDTPAGKDFPTADPPAELDWDTWLGPAAKVPYVKERCHYNFRWWFEYSGGRLTDWGAHHVDIAQWAIAPDLPGPTTVEPISAELPVRLERGLPTVHNAYNTATRFHLKCTFANGVDMFIRDRVDGFPTDNGILIEGDGGFCFVDRERLTGSAVEQLKHDPLPEGMVRRVDESIKIPHERHFINFLECCRTRQAPNSDVWSHHRHLTTCHLANVAMRLGRKVRWDATAQEIVGDPEADAFQSRAQRRGFELT